MDVKFINPRENYVFIYDQCDDDEIEGEEDSGGPTKELKGKLGYYYNEEN